MTPPTVYADWVEALDAFRAGDHDVIVALERGSLPLQEGVVERLLKRVSAAFSGRLAFALERLEREVGAGSGSERVTRALTALRRHVDGLHRLGRVPMLPAEFGARLVNALRETLADLDRELTKASQSTGDGAFALCVRHARIGSWLDDASGPVNAEPVIPAGPTGQRRARRTVIL